MAHQRGIFPRIPQPSRKGHLRPQRVLGGLRQAPQQGRVEQPWSDGHHPDTVLGELARDGERHADDPSLGSRVGRLADLAFERRDRGGVDDHPPLPLGVGVVLGHGLGRQANGIERADQIDVDHRREKFERHRPLAPQHAGGLTHTGAIDGEMELAEP